MILNNFPGAGRKISETTLTPENARAGYYFVDANGNYGDGSISDYEGIIAVTPSTDAQVLATAGKYAPGNITVEAIPSVFRRVGTRVSDTLGGSGVKSYTVPITFASGTSAEYITAALTAAYLVLSHYNVSSVTGSNPLELTAGINWLVQLYKRPGDLTTFYCCYVYDSDANAAPTFYTVVLENVGVEYVEDTGIVITLPADADMRFMPTPCWSTLVLNS